MILESIQKEDTLNMKTWSKQKKIRAVIIALVAITIVVARRIHETNAQEIHIASSYDVVSHSIPVAGSKNITELTKGLTELARYVYDNRKLITEVIETATIVDETPTSENVYVDAALVNFRESPTLSAPVLNKLSYQTQLTASSYVTTDKNEEWVSCSINGVNGYIMREFVTTDAPIIYMGKFLITHYCGCEICCDVAGRPTASGKMPKSGRTIAADKSIPFGTKLIIDNIEYTVEDRGGAVNGMHIDIYCDSHAEAKRAASYYSDVYAPRYK